MSQKIINCFIASPGDTAEERKVCLKIIEEMNHGLGMAYGFSIKSLTWENNSRPAVGDYSQAVISDQLGDDYQIFIGIMYKKFGTPTKSAGSGTEEEFDKAYEKVKTDNIELMFYFNDAPSQISEIDITELSKIKAFKERLKSLGAYYWPYNGVLEFENFLRKHLTDHFNKIYSNEKDVAVNIQISEAYQSVCSKLEERLNKALVSFDSQPAIWVEPVLSSTNKISTNADENYSNRVQLNEIIENPDSIIIRASPQFGLTCLAHYFVMEAWKLGKTWIYLDSDKLKVHNIHNGVSHECEALKIDKAKIECIILDSWDRHGANALKKLKNLCEAHPAIPIIVMESVDDAKFLVDIDDEDDTTLDREFSYLFLLALPRTQIRKVIAEYNKEKSIGDEDLILAKIISDLEVLNMHRTPLNCITLLKASEKQFDDSPVNRTVMLETVLFVLFNMDGLPRYRTKPDLKDCEYILGKLCEEMIRADSYNFTRDSFIHRLQDFCKEKLIDVDVDIVFDILAANNIIVQKGSNFAFKATYWIFYFAAKRMHIDILFRDYIYSSKKYTSFPKMIEFYTGIDRNRADALTVLYEDIKETCNTVVGKVGMMNQMNPLNLMKWMPTETQIEQAQKEIGENVVKSSLPDNIKDQHADVRYHQIRPYNQNIRSFFEEYSVYNLIQKMKASARALRNSDYVDSEIKSKILKEILRSWEQIAVVLFVIAPSLASKGQANLEGASFTLTGDFGNTFEEKMNLILQVIPSNVVGFFKDDLFSSKIAPLLFEEFKNELNEMKKHHLALLFVYTRPKNWKAQIEEYIVSLSKNSFYLYDTVNNLKARYAYDFATENEVREIAILIKMGLTKHQTGDKRPNMGQVLKVPNYELPPREVKGNM
ncbi:hypothetical protein [Pedobacter sp. UC225_65]|uniref:STAND family AAA ATPase n=1 Tax=Pedobacter sp. UC225_65 TaxID=3350173 RepID=UPI00366F58C9